MRPFPVRPLRLVPPLLGACLLVVLAACGHAEPAVVAPPVLVVQPGAPGAGLTAYAGEIRAREEPQLAFRLSGKIARRLVDVGDRVAAGQPLAELEASDVGLQVESARAALASAESDYALARAELARYKNLSDQQLVSRSLYDTRVAQAHAAAARVRQARAQSGVAGNQASYAVLRAPRAGVIAQRLAEAGQVVAAGQPVFVLAAAAGGLEVAISVPEQRIAQFQPGRRVAVEVWASPGHRLPGEVREIAPAADPLTRTYAARIRFDGAAAHAEVGQSARVYAQDASGASLAVPLSAIVEHDGQPAVWVVRRTMLGEGKQRHSAIVVRSTPVRIGPYGEDSVPVLSGLQPDDWVVAAGAHLLQPDQAVRPVDRHDRAVSLAPSRPAVAAR